MILRWFHRRRRGRIRARPLPDRWRDVITHNVAYVARLGEDERNKLESDTQVFVAEKNWEGCGGLVMSDEIRVTIAAQISLLCLGFQDEYFDMTDSILVYPDAYTAPSRQPIGDGFFLEELSDCEGEAWYRGPVVLSWADVLEDGRCDDDGNNLVLHEFAHQLDMQNGSVADGTPPLNHADQYIRWQTVINNSFRRLQSDCRYRRSNILDDYGATDLGEFFAVATECFFERPIVMRRQDSELYAILADYYRQDPAARFTS